MSNPRRAFIQDTTRVGQMDHPPHPYMPHPGQQEYAGTSGGMVGHHGESHAMAMGHHPVYMHFPSFPEAEYLSQMGVPLDYPLPPPPGLILDPGLPGRGRVGSAASFSSSSALGRKDPPRKTSKGTTSSSGLSRKGPRKDEDEEERLFRKRAQNAGNPWPFCGRDMQVKISSCVVMAAAAAKRARERKAIRMATFEETIEQLQKENALLVARNTQLEAVNRSLMLAQEALQHKVNALSSSSSSSASVADTAALLAPTPSSISPAPFTH